ncbi:MAG: hypothetical protein PHP08_00430 [Candidatus Dojkabacteria bacterium]|nr:hypothetical protein [Candidatus Dojkabacteria bacterium]
MAYYRERDLKAFANEVAGDGIGIGGGFIVGGAIGRAIETSLVKDSATASGQVDETSSATKKVLAWAANNGAKAGAYVLAKKFDAKHPMAKKAAESLAGSVVYDSVLRLANKGVNPYDVRMAGYRVLGNGMNPATVQKLVQENSILRTELNKALQKLAGPGTYPPSPSMPGTEIPPGRFPGQGLAEPGTIIQNPPAPTPPTATREWQDYRSYVRQTPYRADSSADFRYAGDASPAVQQRQREYGAMPNPNSAGIPWLPETGYTPGATQQIGPINQLPWTPDVMERQRRYGTMPFEQSPQVVERERKFGSMPYGAMPFEQHTEKTERQRFFGQMQDKGLGVMYDMYGMR